MYDHRCSEDQPGGFFSRVEMGTWMGHVIEHIALEIQTLAGMDVGFGRTRETSTKGVYNVVFGMWFPLCIFLPIGWDCGTVSSTYNLATFISLVAFATSSRT